jgi:hypothetical protein
LEYGYQQQQFCKMPRFCIPVLLNESSPPFSWVDLLQVRNGRVNCGGREGGRACSWIWVFIRIRRIGWFADMGFCTSFLSKLCRFYHIAPNWSLCFFYKKKLSLLQLFVFVPNVFSFQFHLHIITFNLFDTLFL